MRSSRLCCSKLQIPAPSRVRRQLDKVRSDAENVALLNEVVRERVGLRLDLAAKPKKALRVVGGASDSAPVYLGPPPSWDAADIALAPPPHSNAHKRPRTSAVSAVSGSGAGPVVDMSGGQTSMAIPGGQEVTQIGQLWPMVSRIHPTKLCPLVKALISRQVDMAPLWRSLAMATEESALRQSPDQLAQLLFCFTRLAVQKGELESGWFGSLLKRLSLAVRHQMDKDMWANPLVVFAMKEYALVGYRVELEDVYQAVVRHVVTRKDNTHKKYSASELAALAPSLSSLGLHGPLYRSFWLYLEAALRGNASSFDNLHVLSLLESLANPRPRSAPTLPPAATKGQPSGSLIATGGRTVARRGSTSSRSMDQEAPAAAAAGGWGYPSGDVVRLVEYIGCVLVPLRWSGMTDGQRGRVVEVMKHPCWQHMQWIFQELSSPPPPAQPHRKQRSSSRRSTHSDAPSLFALPLPEFIQRIVTGGHHTRGSSGAGSETAIAIAIAGEKSMGGNGGDGEERGKLTYLEHFSVFGRDAERVAVKDRRSRELIALAEDLQQQAASGGRAADAIATDRSAMKSLYGARLPVLWHLPRERLKSFLYTIRSSQVAYHVNQTALDSAGLAYTPSAAIGRSRGSVWGGIKGHKDDKHARWYVSQLVECVIDRHESMKVTDLASCLNGFGKIHQRSLLCPADGRRLLRTLMPAINERTLDLTAKALTDVLNGMSLLYPLLFHTPPKSKREASSEEAAGAAKPWTPYPMIPVDGHEGKGASSGGDGEFVLGEGAMVGLIDGLATHATKILDMDAVPSEGLVKIAASLQRLIPPKLIHRYAKPHNPTRGASPPGGWRRRRAFDAAKDRGSPLGYRPSCAVLDALEDAIQRNANRLQLEETARTLHSLSSMRLSDRPVFATLQSRVAELLPVTAADRPSVECVMSFMRSYTSRNASTQPQPQTAFHAVTHWLDRHTDALPPSAVPLAALTYVRMATIPPPAQQARPPSSPPRPRAPPKLQRDAPRGTVCVKWGKKGKVYRLLQAKHAAMTVDGQGGEDGTSPMMVEEVITKLLQKASDDPTPLPPTDIYRLLQTAHALTSLPPSPSTGAPRPQPNTPRLVKRRRLPPEASGVSAGGFRLADRSPVRLLCDQLSRRCEQQLLQQKSDLPDWLLFRLALPAVHRPQFSISTDVAASLADERRRRMANTASSTADLLASSDTAGDNGGDGERSSLVGVAWAWQEASHEGEGEGGGDGEEGGEQGRVALRQQQEGG
ncbi:unnamed protein product [Vitrella brassicaformis CCMP3155]|uniref:Uncharacterized protein n=2 Tax=Vitrella brassicaformis TaxID=1169539 RepID=A0A0G4EUA0_VITBC|nr:unnamed protein product [Vitrella brassicaformis CCMP3155]|eukprot:CEM01997.1 unnamed protein product [Vitrella brassicaformis CCMP3155]